jgi:ubiquinone/menaquinone biosynthesis C-methylase UbiE
MDDVARPVEQAHSLHVEVIPGNTIVNSPVSLVPAASAPEIPDYMQEIYYWAYLNPRNVKLLDRELVVRTILWQQHKRLQRLAFAEIEPGQSVLQSTCVYGSFSANLAEHIGRDGTLDIVDVAKVQVDNARLKLQAYPQIKVHHANVLHLGNKPFDVVLCYFLLHELPDVDKHKAANVLLNKVAPGGKVVFVDYHKPRWWHPIKPITSLVFDWLEPFAKGLWRKEIRDFADKPERFSWRKEPCFGDLFQKVVATRIS